MAKKKAKKKPGSKYRFTVKRSKWTNGVNRITNVPLIDGTKKAMCCLGHLRTALGIKNKLNATSPEECPSKKWPDTILKYHEDGSYSETNLCEQIIFENDFVHSTLEEKEKELTKLFKRAGIKVTFVD